MTSAEVQKAMDGWRTFAQEYSCDAVDGIGWLIISLGARLANFTDEEEARITLASLRDHAREWLAERCYIVSTIVVGGMVGIGFRRDPADGEVNVSHDTLDAALQAAIRAAGLEHATPTPPGGIWSSSTASRAKRSARRR